MVLGSGLEAVLLEVLELVFFEEQLHLQPCDRPSVDSVDLDSSNSSQGLGTYPLYRQETLLIPYAGVPRP